MKKYLILTLAVALLLAALSILPIHGEGEIYDNVIRLHVLANSDSAEDQALKLMVRDAIVAESEGLLDSAKSRDEAEAILRAALPRLKQTAEQAVARAGYRTEVDITLGMESYPTRQYEQLAFPAGDYLSLRVLLGEAEGQNWWCVLFPPLCLSAATDARDNKAVCLSAGLSGEQYRLIADTDNTKYKLRFKILEVFEDMFG